MTAQINDRIFHHGREMAIAGINGEGLFEPQQIGIAPVMISTACWRGYYCVYEIVDGALFLSKLTVGLAGEDRARAERGEGPLVFGKALQPFDYAFVAQGLQERIPFTGGLLLAADFIPEMYVHMGFHAAYTYQTVQELIFERGSVVHEHDRSAAMAEIRRNLPPHAAEPGFGASQATVQAWVQRCFSRRY